MRSQAIISLGNLFASGHYFLVVYIVAPYLATFMPEDEVGLVVAAGAAVTLVLFPFIPKLAARFHPRQMAIALSVVEIIILGSLAFSPTALVAIVLVALQALLSPLIAYQLDLLLEASVAEEGVTGQVRTIFLTAENITLIFAPLIVGFLLGESDAYGRVFLAAAASLIPFILVLLHSKYLPTRAPSASVSFIETARCMFKNTDLRASVLAGFVLQFFYHAAPLYLPLYLHTALHIPWSDIGWMFSLMLLPFLLLEYPAGHLADRWFGDKEIMFLGFGIMGASFAIIGFIPVVGTMGVLVGVLISSRVGAALAEAMTEGHFFRRVSEKDATSVSVYRMIRPLAALAAPLAGSVLLFVSDYQGLFLALGVFVALVGGYAAFRIVDIK